MKTKLFVLLSVCVILLACEGIVYADSGEGYFGDDEVIDANPDTPFLPPMPTEDELEEEYENEDSEVATEKNTKASIWKKPPEKYSEDTAKVINSYGLSKKRAKNLINNHKDAAAGMGNKEKVKRYQNILRQFPMDYLAAYRAAEATFAMGRNSQALRWVNQSLAIYPDYMPARRLKKQIEGALK